MIKKALSSELAKGSLILFVMFNFYNVLNFVFHFSMGRLLGPENYGVLAVLMSIIYIYSIPTEAIQNIISKYVSDFNLKEEYGKINFLVSKSSIRAIQFASLIFLVSIIIAMFLSKILQINFYLIILTNVALITSFTTPIVRGALQGRKKFVLLGTGMIFEGILKLSFAVIFVLIGFKVFGAIIGLLIGAFAGLIISFYFNRDIFKEKKETVYFNEVYKKSIPYFIVVFIILVILSLDIILAKIFFSAEIVGKYAVLSMLGKIIFFGTIPLGKTMFPLTSEKQDDHKNSMKLFKKSFLMVLVLCLLAILAYAILPKLIIQILYGSDYVDMSKYLVYSAIALSFLSLSNLVLTYGLSTNKIKNAYYLFFFLILDIVLLSLFHSTILQYLIAFMVSNIVMFIGSFFFIRYKNEDKHSNSRV